MKTFLIMLTMAVLLPFSSFGQDSIGYWSALPDGKFYRMDLEDAGKTLIDTTLSSFIAGDFGTDNVLYAIHSSDNGWYKIDTTDGTATLLGTNPPPANHIWTGLAYDDSTGIMYGVSANDASNGESTIYTIDESDGSYSIVGSQGTARAISCIAIDGDGQMYGLQLSGVAKIYKINKSNGSVVELGPIGQGAAGMGHAMDYDRKSETMYLSTYNSMTFQNTLRIVNLTDGSTTEVGDVGVWTGIFAVKPLIPLNTDFSADKTKPCHGNAVHFTDESQGATSWSWVFEGGLPPTSSYQNPTVIYRDPGNYDVELTASNGVDSETKIKEDYISVLDDLTPEIEGVTQICKEEASDYSTEENDDATFVWTVSGGEIIAGDSTNLITVLWGAPGNGTVDLEVTVSGDCTGEAETLEVTIDDCVGFEDIETNSLRIYPNPATSQVNIQSENPMNTIRVYDFTGKVVAEEQAGNTNYRLNTSKFKSGIYLIVIETSAGKFRKRLVIE
jgi:PKD repeat protein